MQVFWTVVSGTAVYIIGQVVLHFVLEPIKKFNEQRSDTSFLLLFQQAKITNASSSNPKLNDDLKEMGAALISSMKQIPFYSTVAKLFWVAVPRTGLRGGARVKRYCLWNIAP